MLAAPQARTNPLDVFANAFGPSQTLDETEIGDQLEIDVASHPLIGPYKLLEQIGEGGMGVVYVAQQQQPIRRMVALKLIKPGLDSKQVVARFEAERQALAMMNHPNIAKVLDAGTMETGSPYFVMELVKGIPITEYCDTHKLDLRQRLELFIKVCDAVQHAHQKGIIHRDLKPSNVLVELDDVRAIPKVIDFGVAKAMQQQLTENTLHTGINQMIGTPLYMSPEQTQMTSLDVDTRSDVYSLGVMLYELLTDSTPFDKEIFRKAGFDEMRRMIREDDPPRPSAGINTLKAEALSTTSGKRFIDPRKLGHSMATELDWIVMKAMEKDRTRHYESPSALAADVSRYLADQAVEACPPSAWYRVSKLTRRHRAALMTSCLVGLVMLVGAGLSIWQAVRATKAERRSEERSELARHAVDDMYSQFAEKWIAEQGTLTEIQREFLEKALVIYREFSTETDADPRYQWEAMRALERVARIQSSLGEHSAAEASYRKLITQSTELRSKYPNKSEFRVMEIAGRTLLAAMLRTGASTTVGSC